jgi:diguanylate cyclase (GGDEF)-like protein
MSLTDQTLLEQMQITEFDIEFRQRLFGLAGGDAKVLVACKPTIERKIDELVDEFYRLQTSISEIALLIGDAETLGRLRTAQRRYILDLFSGVYDLDYVNNRLRIGLVHKRIGVEPKLYLSAVRTLKGLLYEAVRDAFHDESEYAEATEAIDKLLQFDVTLVFDTYIRSLVFEIETAKDKAERYARSLEEKVRERTKQLEEQSRSDPLTGLLNVRQLRASVTKLFRAAQRRNEPVTAVYVDIDNFKEINDRRGHQHGDEVLKRVAGAIKSIVFPEDTCFRYGGDEFCVVLTNCTEEQAREKFVTRLRGMLQQTMPDVSLSIGVAQNGPEEYDGVDTLIRRADQRMYVEKRVKKGDASGSE